MVQSQTSGRCWPEFRQPILNEALTRLVSASGTGQNGFRAYPLFLVLFIFVFFAATCLAEFLYARRVVRKAGVRVSGPRWSGRSSSKSRFVAILGPVYFFIEYPEEIHEFMADGPAGQKNRS